MLDGFDFYRYWKATAAVNTAFFVAWTIGGVHGALMQWRGRMGQSCSCCVSCSTAAPCITAGAETSAQHVTNTRRCGSHLSAVRCALTPMVTCRHVIMSGRRAGVMRGSKERQSYDCSLLRGREQLWELFGPSHNMHHAACDAARDKHQEERNQLR